MHSALSLRTRPFRQFSLSSGPFECISIGHWQARYSFQISIVLIISHPLRRTIWLLWRQFRWDAMRQTRRNWLLTNTFPWESGPTNHSHPSSLPRALNSNLLLHSVDTNNQRVRFLVAYRRFPSTSRGLAFVPKLFSSCTDLMGTFSIVGD
jgi:hypothetical protein